MKYRDIVRHGSYDEVLDSFISIRKHMAYLEKRIEREIERSDRSVILQNTLKTSIKNINIIISHNSDQNTLLAWATRNLYELNLITRFVLQSNENMDETFRLMRYRFV